jgi:hypothetical protein
MPIHDLHEMAGKLINRSGPLAEIFQIHSLEEIPNIPSEILHRVLLIYPLFLLLDARKGTVRLSDRTDAEMIVNQARLASRLQLSAGEPWPVVEKSLVLVPDGYFVPNVDLDHARQCPRYKVTTLHVNQREVPDWQLQIRCERNGITFTLNCIGKTCINSRFGKKLEILGPNSLSFRQGLGFEAMSLVREILPRFGKPGET